MGGIRRLGYLTPYTSIGASDELRLHRRSRGLVILRIFGLGKKDKNKKCVRRRSAPPRGSQVGPHGVGGHGGDATKRQVDVWLVLRF